MALEVGQVLRRRSGGGSIRLVASDNGDWIAEPADTFGAPFRVSPAGLVEDFRGVKDPTPPRDLSDEDLRRADVAANDRAVHAYGRANAHRETGNERAFAEQAAALAGREPVSPEDRFREIAEAEDDNRD